MININAALNGHVLTLKQSPTLASGSVAVDTVHFEFDDIWTGLAKTALFWAASASDPYAVLLDTDDNAAIPWEVIQERSTLKFGVYGTEPGQTVPRITSTLVRYRVEDGAWSSVLANSGDPTPTVIEQLMAAVAGVEQSAVQYAAVQDLTDAQKEQARDNIDAASSADMRALEDKESALRAYVRELSPAITAGPDAAVTVSDAAPLDAESVVVAIEPAQSGSDDPSPENVRPITGWTGAKVIRTGKNLLEITVENTTVNGLTFTVDKDASGNVASVTVNGTATANTYFAIKRNLSLLAGDYILSGCPSGGGSSTYTVNVYTDNPARWKGSDIGETKAFTVSENYTPTYYDRCEIVINSGYTASDLVFYPMIRLAAETDDTFEPYRGDAYDIGFGEAGTVYGGTLDAVNGVLTARPYYPSYNGEALTGPWVSSMDTYAPGATPTTGAQVVDMGGAPTVYQLTPTEIAMLKGVNIVSADCGKTTLAYRQDIYTVLDRRIADLESADIEK